MELLLFLEKWIWLGLAALGFAILFNVPTRTLWVIFLMAAMGGSLKLITMHWGGGIIMGSFAGAMLVGFLSIAAAHSKHSPPMVFAIPSVIPMVPGAFAYKAILGVISLTSNPESIDYGTILEKTINNGLTALFVVMALAVGVSTPMLLTRRESAKEIRIPNPIEKIVHHENN